MQPDAESTEYRGGIPVTPQQATVVDNVLRNQVTVVGAGAGAGKTHTIVATILQLLEDRQATIDQFVLITFTNDAADAMRNRLQEALSNAVQDAIKTNGDAAFWLAQVERLPSAYVGTIHGLCRQLLRTFGYAERVARESNMTVARDRLDEALHEAVVHALSQNGEILLNPRLQWQVYHLEDLVEDIFNALRSRDISPEVMLAQTESQEQDDGKPYRVAVASLVTDFAQRYAQLKTKDQLLDANDLIIRTAELLKSRSGPAVASHFSDRCRYLFIDEFQDTDPVQKQIIDALLPGLRGLLIVGDKKQAIYGFRWADSSLLKATADEHGVDVLALNVSRRPSRDLLNLQNALFGSIARTYPDLNEPLEAMNETLGRGTSFPAVTYSSAGVIGISRQDRIARTAIVVQRLLAGQIDGPEQEDEEHAVLRLVRPGDIAILVRSNAQLADYKTGLRAQGLDVREDQRGRFFQHPAIVSTYFMLRLLLLYPDSASLAIALRTPYLSGVDPSAKELDLLQYGYTSGKPFIDWFEQHHSEHAATLAELRAAVRLDTVPQILSRLYTAFNIREFYLQTGDRAAADNLEKLREISRRLFNEEQALTLRSFVRWMKRIYVTGREEREADWIDEDANTDAGWIRIQTIHKAKGLEYPIVVLPEVQVAVSRPEMDPKYMIIPEFGLDLNLSEWGAQTKSTRYDVELLQGQQDHREEEMRVLYVAATRAQRAIAMIGSGGQRPNPMTDRNYSWKDEVLNARDVLTPLGALFEM